MELYQMENVRYTYVCRGTLRTQAVSNTDFHIDNGCREMLDEALRNAGVQLVDNCVDSEIIGILARMDEVALKLWNGLQEVSAFAFSSRSVPSNFFVRI